MTHAKQKNLKIKWEKSPEFLALSRCSIMGGANKQALSHFIKTIEKQALFEGYLKGREEGINLYRKIIKKTKLAIL